MDKYIINNLRILKNKFGKDDTAGGNGSKK
jgi:hypothetical protein